MSSINYNLSLIRGVALDIDGVLSPTVVPASDSGKPVRMLNVKDGYALGVAVKAGLKIAVISGGDSVAMMNRCRLLGINDVYLNVSDKESVFKTWMHSQGLKPEEVAFMGDDIPDLKCMRISGLSCAPYDAAAEARREAIYVSRFTGGYGCVRDLFEQILKAQSLWPVSY